MTSEKKKIPVLADLSIGARLAIGYAILLGLMILIALTGIARLHSSGKLADEMATKTMAAERITTAWFSEINTNSVRTVAIAKSEDPDAQAYFQQQVDITNGKITDIQKQVDALVETDEGRVLLKRITEHRQAYLSAAEGVFNKKRGGRHSAALKMIDEEFLPAVETYLAGVRALVTYQQGMTHRLAQESEAHFRHGSLLMIALGATALVLGLILASLSSRSITRPLREAVRIAEKVAKGDLSTHIEVNRRDETGQLLLALRDMNSSLNGVIASVRTGTDTISNATRQIASGSSDLSRRTMNQATSIEETASALSALTRTVRENAENAAQASRLVEATAQVAQNGEKAFGEVVETMRSIESKAARIADIIGVIDGIAFQSNILALNAAVEAARAGAHGRGFAVVATEVRSLSQRSSLAAREIKALINDSLDSVGHGNRLVLSAHRAMDEIVHSVRGVISITGQISAASHQQSAGLEQIDRVMAEMDRVTQLNAGLVDEAASAARSLEEQTLTLAQSVSVFQLAAAAEQAVEISDQAATDRQAAFVSYRKPTLALVHGRAANTSGELIA